MKGFRTTSYFTIIISIFYLLSIFPAVLADCDKCEALPPDCQPGQSTPFSGGPPCTCTTTQQPQGCILKPCEQVQDDSLCDCTHSIGSVKYRFFCRKYRCSGESGQCQSCKNLPPDCTMKSYENPPASRGPDCSCENQMAPGGCTLKACKQDSLTPTPCVSKPGGVSSVFLYGATCPGSFDASGGGAGSGAKIVKSTDNIPGFVLLVVFGYWLNLVA